MNSIPYGQDPPFVPPYTSGEAADSRNDSGEFDLPKYHGAPPYSLSEEKGDFAGSDVKVKEVDSEDMSHERDLAGRVEFANDYGRSDSEVTLSGRQGEGRV